MFLIPFVKKPDWRHPPVVTLLLILINVVVFAGFQAGDAYIEERASDYYRASDLPRLELPRYRLYLLEQQRDDDARQIARLADNARLQEFANHLMEGDADFMRELRADRVIRPDMPEYAVWKSQRSRLDELKARLVTERFMFHADRFDPITWLTSMFMHGSWGHLIGNMLVLAITGYIVEEVLGRTRYLAYYLLCGVGATAVFWAFHFGTGTGALGASGAIAGVMGMYSVLFGLKRVNFFFSLLFYFDIRRAPAIILLPLWVANEIFQLLYVRGPIGYHAHIGGFLTGGMLAAVYRWRHRTAVDAYHDRAHAPQIEQERRVQRLARARRHLADIELDKALTIYESLLEREPDDRELMLLAYRTARQRPESDSYHRAAARVLELSGSDEATARLVHETYTEYLRLARPAVRVATTRWLKLARRFCDDGQLADAERLVSALLRNPSPPPELPQLMLRLAHACHHARETERARGWLVALEEHFAQSEAASMAADLKRSGSLP
jgi:membrane associated rhomboid family serine protease